MSRSVSSERIQELIAGYVLGDLDSAEALELQQLLAENPSLRHEIAALQDASEAVWDIPDAAPSVTLRSKLLASQVQEREVSTVVAIDAPRPNRFPVFKTLGLIAAGMIIGLGVNNYRLWRSLQIAREELVQKATLTYTLEGTESFDRAIASLEVDPNSLEGQLIGQNLPALPDNQVYALWTIPTLDALVTTDQNGAILTGVFDGSDNATSTSFSVPPIFRQPELVSAVAITVENRESPQQHTGSIILLSR